MKKLFAILCALACFAMLFIPAMAAPEGDTVTVHAQVPSDWTDVAAYTWNPDALGAWPGTKMELNGEWYECEMSGAQLKLIINNNNNGKQTADLDIESGKDIWVVVNDDLTATISYTAPGAVVEPDDSTEDPTTAPTEEEEPTTTAPAEEEEPTTEAPSKGEGEEEADKTTTTGKKEQQQMTKEERAAARRKVYIVLAISLVVIVGIACVLSIPKKIR